MNTATFVRANRYWLTFLLLIALLYYGWTEITRTRGAQTVSLIPALRHCAAAGQLRYCVYTDTAGTNGDVVYHLHGRNLDETVWNDDTYFTTMLQAQWQNERVLPPTVIEVTYGPSWILTPKGEKAPSGLLVDFMSRLSEIEAKVGKPRRRMLMGESMGGLNVLIAGLSYPEQFAKVAALCPGVYVESPFASFSTMRATMRRTGASPETILGIWIMARKYVADEREWRRIAPLNLMRQANPGYPALYLSCGLYDAYGNYEGTQRLAGMARERGLKIDWHPIYGGHCAVDIPSIASFLAD